MRGPIDFSVEIREGIGIHRFRPVPTSGKQAVASRLNNHGCPFESIQGGAVERACIDGATSRPHQRLEMTASEKAAAAGVVGTGGDLDGSRVTRWNRQQ